MKDFLLDQIGMVIEMAAECEEFTLGELMPRINRIKPEPGREIFLEHSGITVRAFDNCSYALLEYLDELCQDETYASMPVCEFIEDELIAATIVLKRGEKFFQFGNEDGHCLTLLTIIHHLDDLTEDFFLECRDDLWATTWEHDSPAFMARGKKSGRGDSSFGLSSKTVH